MATKATVPGMNRQQTVTLGITIVGGVIAVVLAGWAMNAYRKKVKFINDAHAGYDSGVL